MFTEPLAEVVGDRKRVRDELLSSQRVPRDMRAVGEPRAPLLPPDDIDEVLEARWVSPAQEVFGHSSVHGALDIATPPQLATQQLLPYLPNGHQVVLPGVGHIASLFENQPQAGAHLINTFFATGQVDDSMFQPRTLDFTPSTTLSQVARLLAGAMVGLALLSVISLVWMARHVRRVGQFGPKTSAVLRSVYALMLGLGGWFLGGLIVTSVLPTSHLDDQRLVVVSTGVTVGLSIYFAWTHRDWAVTTRTVGFATAIAGALLGAWLGINATGGLAAPTDGLLAPFTAVVGAVAGANLGVLILDIWRQPPNELTKTKAGPTREELATSS